MRQPILPNTATHSTTSLPQGEGVLFSRDRSYFSASAAIIYLRFIAWQGKFLISYIGGSTR